MPKRRDRQQDRPAPRHGSWSDLPVQIGMLSWSQWLRATIYSVIVLGAIAAILQGSCKEVGYLIDLIRWP